MAKSGDSLDADAQLTASNGSDVVSTFAPAGFTAENTTDETSAVLTSDALSFSSGENNSTTLSASQGGDVFSLSLPNESGTLATEAYVEDSFANRVVSGATSLRDVNDSSGTPCLTFAGGNEPPWVITDPTAFKLALEIDPGVPAHASTHAPGGADVVYTNFLWDAVAETTVLYVGNEKVHIGTDKIEPNYIGAGNTFAFPTSGGGTLATTANLAGFLQQGLTALQFNNSVGNNAWLFDAAFPPTSGIVTFNIRAGNSTTNVASYILEMESDGSAFPINNAVRFRTAKFDLLGYGTALNWCSVRFNLSNTGGWCEQIVYGNVSGISGFRWSLGTSTPNTPTTQLELDRYSRLRLFSTTGAASMNIGFHGGTGATITSNTALGQACLNAVTTAINCVAIGALAGDQITTGDANVLVGQDAGGAITTGNNNTAVGSDALGASSGGSKDHNTAIGANAGNILSSGSSNTLIGSSATVDAGTRSLCIALGRLATTPAVNGSLAIGGAVGSAGEMTNLTATTAGGSAGKHLNIYLNGVQYKIALLNP